MKDKEKKIQKRLGHRFHAIQSDPSSPAVTRDTAPAPLDLSRVLSGSQRKKLSMIKMSTPPQTPTSLSVDTAVETILKKQQIIRTASGGSQNSGLLKKRSSAGDDASSLNLLPSLNPAGANNQAEGLSSSSVLYSPVAGTSFGYGMHPHVSPRNSAPSHKSSAVITTGVFSPGPASVFSPGPGTATMTFPTPKNNSRKFKMAHESFRIRMFQEQYGFEPVFMTKKRTADSKFSEFKGGDLNKYTAQSYTIKNGNEIFGANIQSEFGICGWILTILSYILIFLTLPISACMVIKVVQEFERAVIFRLGRLMPGGAKGPGIFFVIPCIDTYRKVDLRVLSFEVPPQEILSKDSVTVAVDAVVYFRISNATISVTNVEDSSRSTKLLAQTTLRNILGTKTLAEMLSDREAISLQMQATLDEATEPWGVKVERVEVKDVRLPVQLQRAMAAEAEAAREARAKVIVAEGEQKASRALKEASDVIAQSPQALQLRYLQTLSSISAEKNSTIIFPFPIDLLSSFLPSRPTQKPNTSEATKPHYS